MRKKHFFLFTLETFRKLMVSYALVFLAPLVVSFIIYIASVSLITGEAKRTNEASLLLLKQMVDAKVDGLYIAADQLSINEKARSVALASEPVTAMQRLSMSEVQGLLVQVKLANSFIQGIYLYLPGSDYILSNVSRYRGDEFSLVAEGDFGTSVDGWRAELMAGGYREAKALSWPGQGANPTVVFTQKFFYEGMDRPSAVLAMVVDGRNLASLLVAVKGDPSAKLAVAARQGIFRSDPDGRELPDWLSYDRMSSSYAAAERDFEGRRYIAASVGSDKAQLRYESLIPTDVYGRSASFIGRVMLVYVALCLAGGLVLSYEMAKRNYTPIQRLTRLFIDRLGGPGREAEGEGFAFLEEALEDLLDENAGLEETIRKQNETLRGSLVSRLLHSAPGQTAGLLESCEACGIHFPTGNFVLIAAFIDVDEASASLPDGKRAGELSSYLQEGGQGFTSASEGFNGDAEALVGYMLRRVLEQYAGEHHAAYAVDSGGATVCLVGLSIDESADPTRLATRAEMRELAARTRDLFGSRFGIGLSFAIGRPRESLSAIPLAMAEIERLAETITLYERRGVIVEAEGLTAAAAPAAAPGGSLALHRLLAERAYAGDFASVSAEVRRYLSEELMAGEVPLETAKLRMSGVVNMVSEILAELGPSLELRLQEELNPVDRLSKVKSIPELERQVAEIFSVLETNFGRGEPAKAAGLKDEVARYVRENFGDPNLNVNSVAERFGVSVAHLSRSFKRDAGMGLLDYIHSVRVREARELLTRGGLTIEEIAKRVGCGSRVTLVRAFKRFKGVAPKDFRGPS